jgi:hypothetical protein
MPHFAPLMQWRQISLHLLPSGLVPKSSGLVMGIAHFLHLQDASFGEQQSLQHMVYSFELKKQINSYSIKRGHE